VSVISKAAQFIHCGVVLITGGPSVMLTGVYGYNTVADRQPLFQDLASLTSSAQVPWLVIGDFNAALSSQDRFQGNPVVDAETHSAFVGQ